MFLGQEIRALSINKIRMNNDETNLIAYWKIFNVNLEDVQGFIYIST